MIEVVSNTFTDEEKLLLERKFNGDAEKMLRAENLELKEKLSNYIPRRRVRRVFKDLKKILHQDIDEDFNKDIERLKYICHTIEVNDACWCRTPEKKAIEHVLSNFDIIQKDEEIWKEHDIMKRFIIKHNLWNEFLNDEDFIKYLREDYIGD